MQPSIRPENFLNATPIVNSDHPVVQAYAAEHRGTSNDPLEQAVALYYAVRDQIYYDPYFASVTVEGLQASATLENKRGWCIPKAATLAAVCRASGIPARVGFADVRNHLSTERLRQALQTDVYYWHGYTSIYLNEQWVKATPAFNIELCQKMNLHTLEFDGNEDSIYHPFDLEGRQHMEYLNFRGEYADPPVDAILQTFSEKYPPLTMSVSANFAEDVERESANLA